MLRVSSQIAVYPALVLLMCLTLFIVFGDSGLLDLSEKKRQRDAMVRRNEQLVRENLTLYKMIERLESDPAYIEAVAKKELGLIREDELIFKIQDDAGATQPKESGNE